MLLEFLLITTEKQNDTQDASCFHKESMIVIMLCVIHILTFHTGATRCRKRTRMETAMTKALTIFTRMQEESEKRFREWEEERWRKETELEEKRRVEERAHELQVLRLLSQNQPIYTHPSHHNILPSHQNMFTFNTPQASLPTQRDISPTQAPLYEDY